MAKTKKDITAELEKLGVDFSEEDTVGNLAKILATAKVDKVATDKAEKGSKGKFVVIDANGKPYSRTFSKREEAEECAKNIHGRIK